MTKLKLARVIHGHGQGEGGQQTGSSFLKGLRKQNRTKQSATTSTPPVTVTPTVNEPTSASSTQANPAARAMVRAKE